MQCRRCPRNCKRRAAVQHKSLKPRGFGKAGQQQRPVSQETCPDNIFVHGRGVPVVRQQTSLARCPLHASAMAFAPNHGVEAMSLLSLPVATLGTPRIGPRRELKLALESYWAGKSNETQLLEAASGLRAANWARQKSLGVTVIPSNDFSLYDHVLDTSVMVGAIPEIYGWTSAACAARDLLRHGARRARRRSRCELRSRPSRAWRGGAGDDQVVRHQLSLHGARISQGSGLHALLSQADRGI